MKKHDDFDRSLNAALASLPQLRPSAAFSRAVLSRLAERPAAAPLWPLAAAGAASSLLLAAAASRLTISIPRVAAFAAEAAGTLELCARLALRVLPAPRAGAEISAAAVLAAILFLLISMPQPRQSRFIGAKS